MLFCVSAYLLLPQSSRSQGTAPHPREHRAEARYPMEFVHVIGGIDTVHRTKGAEHLGRQLQIDHVDHLVAVKAELAS